MKNIILVIRIGVTKAKTNDDGEVTSMLPTNAVEIHDHVENINIDDNIPLDILYYPIGVEIPDSVLYVDIAKSVKTNEFKVMQVEKFHYDWTEHCQN